MRNLRLSQTDLGARVGVLYRTIGHWRRGDALPNAARRAKLVAAIHAIDPATAAEVAAAAGAPLGGGGGAAPSRSGRTLAGDSIVCAGLEAFDGTPKTFRRALGAAFARARELGMTLEGAEAELANKP